MQNADDKRPYQRTDGKWVYRDRAGNERVFSSDSEAWDYIVMTAPPRVSWAEHYA